MSDEQNEAEQNTTPATGDRPDGKSYDASQITALEGIEGIRLRPAMYIGGTNTVGLHHLVYELLDNAVDEYVNGFATRVTVRIKAERGNNRENVLIEKALQHIGINALNRSGEFRVDPANNPCGISMNRVCSCRLKFHGRQALHDGITEAGNRIHTHFERGFVRNSGSIDV